MYLHLHLNTQLLCTSIHIEQHQIKMSKIYKIFTLIFRLGTIIVKRKKEKHTHT